MRALVDEARLADFMRELGRRADAPGRVYLTGGASAVLLGWRSATIDVDLTFTPERDALYRAIADLKNRLDLNVELAAPSHFVPELPSWTDRSVYIGTFGELQFFHYDFYSQALSKIERGHEHDRRDVASMLAAGLVEPEKLRELVARVESELVRYPAIDRDTLRKRLDEALSGLGS